MPDSGQIDILTPTLSLPERRRAGLKLEFGSLNVVAKKCKLETLSSFDLNSDVGLSDVSTSPFPARTITSHELATRLSNGRSKNMLIVDCRPFLDYSKAHIRGSINVNTIDRQNRKKLQQKGKVALVDLVTTKDGKDIFRRRASKEIIVYDDSTDDTHLNSDNAITSVLSLLFWEGREAFILKGGLREFKSKHENLCDCVLRISDNRPVHSPLTPLVEQQIEGAQMSQILPFLYLGNERDAGNLQTLKDLNITYILNVTSHLRPHFESHGIQYKTIPVTDSGHQNLRKYFEDAIEYIDEARKNGANILIHCQAGVSRSATVTIAYLLKHSTLTMTDAYRYVKQKRAIISPNFNFMGQLMEFEQALNEGQSPRINDKSQIDEIL